jgi:hypothetical protein
MQSGKLKQNMGYHVRLSPTPYILDEFGRPLATRVSRP